ncbi:MAG: hypothetical protein U9N10_08595 [Bacillota bacterium]|nr:hypothetical protein [Bacillota bacterium]
MLIGNLGFNVYFWRFPRHYFCFETYIKIYIKKISGIDDNVLILRRPYFIRRIMKQNKFINDNLTNAEINNVYDLLLKTVKVSDEIKEKHINDIKRKLG